MGFHYHISHDARHLLTRPLNRFFLFQGLYFFGRGILFMFVPIYLYQAGVSLFIIPLYYLILSLLYGLGVVLFAHFVQYIGIRKSFVLSVPFLISYFILLQYIQGNNYPLLLVSILLFICYAALFFPSSHLEMITYSDEKREGEAVSLSNITTTIAVALAPIVGGVLLGAFPYIVSAILVSVILLIAVLPLLGLEDFPLTSYQLSYDNMFRLIQTPQYKKDIIAFISDGINIICDTLLWPMVLMILFQSYARVGLLISLTTIVSIILMWRIGKFIDRHSSITPLKQGTYALLIGWVLRLVSIFTYQLSIFGSPFLYIADSVTRVSSDYTHVPFLAIFYRNAIKEGKLYYILIREMVHNLGKVIPLLFLSLLLYIWGAQALIFVLVIGVVSSLGLSLLTQHE